MRGPIARGTIRTSGVLGLRLLVQAGTLLVVARLLGPHAYGLFAAAASLAVLFGTLSAFGTNLVLLGEVAHSPTRRDAVLAFALPTVLGAGCALLVVYLAACTFAMPMRGMLLSVLLPLGMAEILLQPVLGLCTAEIHGLGWIARSQLLQILPLALRLIVAMAVVLGAASEPLSAYAWGYLFASLAALILTTRLLPAPLPALRLWRLPTPEILREATGYAAINFTKAGPAELDKALAARLLPTAEAGLYSAAARTIAASVLPVTAMTMSALPRLFRDAGNWQMASMGRLLGWMYASAAGYSLLLASALWFAAPLFDALFGPAYTGIASVIRTLCLVVPGLALRLVAGNILMAIRCPWQRTGFEIIGLLVLAASGVLFTARIGAVGLPFALACSEWTMAILGAIFVAHASAQRGTNHHGNDGMSVTGDTTSTESTVRDANP